ncbi:unnamed protein product [Haemonchus placei]|uniref:Fimbrial chaperone protein SefB n=1 Tax=Haemonchus placei TaxID=6290 RepID=A0A0N4WIY1_HAEPC|nr:unnamed protein product [Haemonchus placei]
MKFPLFPGNITIEYTRRPTINGVNTSAAYINFS